MFGCHDDTFKAMCKKFNGIDEADMSYLKLVNIVVCSCTSSPKKMIFWFAVVLNLILLYKI